MNRRYHPEANKDTRPTTDLELYFRNHHDSEPPRPQQTQTVSTPNTATNPWASADTL